MTTFYLVRHGSCDGLGEIIWGRTPGINLNAEGKAQAQQLANDFKHVQLDAIYSSPLERARETAEAIARVANLEVKESLAFNEIDFGNWSGQSLAALDRDDRWHRFNTQRNITRIPGGELFLEVQARAVFELERLSQHHAGGRVVIVSHADVIKAVLGYVGGTPVDRLQEIEIWPCSVNIVALDEHDASVLA
ncbi:MAG TPA: histidine phosphatase family protein [Pyrinomonadaceae bacterium]